MVVLKLIDLQEKQTHVISWKLRRQLLLILANEKHWKLVLEIYRNRKYLKSYVPADESIYEAALRATHGLKLSWEQSFQIFEELIHEKRKPSPRICEMVINQLAPHKTDVSVNDVSKSS